MPDPTIPTSPTTIRPQRDIVRGGATQNLADLREAIIDGIRTIPPITSALLKASPERLGIRLPADPDAALRARTLAQATAHQTALALGNFALHRTWRAADPEGYSLAMGRSGNDAEQLARFDPEAVARRVPAIWSELREVLPDIDLDEIKAACRRESAQAASEARPEVTR